MTQSNGKIIGLTGGIASGKSTVANILIEKGYNLIDGDIIAREVVKIGEPAYIKIIEEFGREILLDNKEINRKALGQIIFNSKEKREKLNNITHPFIFKSIKDKLNKLSKEGNMVFLDIPLLFEQFDLWKRYDIKFDEIILVYLGMEDQIKRLEKRDNITEEEALNKIRSQMSMEEKLKKASKIIDNSGDIQYLKEQIEKVLLELI